MVALAAGLGGSVLGAGTPEIAAAAKATIQACAGGVALCLNNAGIMTLHAIVPGGAIGVGIGKIVVEASLAKTVFNNVKDDLTVSLTVGASWNFRHLAKQGVFRKISHYDHPIVELTGQLRKWLRQRALSVRHVI